MINAIIIEDEQYAINRLKMIIQEIDQPIDIIACINSIEEAVTWLTTNTADLIFLDIHLSDGNAFKIFEQIEVNTPIIFTTAYDEYAMKAFDHLSIDYLLKPISRDRLNQSIEKFQSLRQSQRTENQKHDIQQLIQLITPQKSTKRFMVSIGNKIKILPIDQVAFFSFDSKITFIHTKDEKRYPIEQSLKNLQETTPESDFFRVNRQFLIHRNTVKELHYLSSSRVKVLLNIANDAEIIVAREKISAFKRWLVND